MLGDTFEDQGSTQQCGTSVGTHHWRLRQTMLNLNLDFGVDICIAEFQVMVTMATALRTPSYSSEASASEVQEAKIDPSPSDGKLKPKPGAHFPSSLRPRDSCWYGLAE